MSRKKKPTPESATELPSAATAVESPEPEASKEDSGVDEQAPEPVVQKGKIKFENRLLRDEAIAYFASIVEGLRKKRLTMSHKETTLSMNPGAWIGVKVKASVKGDKQRLELAMEWNRAEEGGALSITTEAPQSES